jgi:hypothetical protein
MSQRYIGGLIYNPPGGFSGYFDGSDDLNAPSNAAFTYGTSDFTIEGWFFITGRSGPNDYEYLFAQGATTGSSSLGVYRQGGVLKVWNGSAVITGTTTLTLNAWNHIALSRSGTTMRLFLNGAQEGSATNSNSISTGSSYGISVGRWTEVDTNYIVGYVSNFRVVKGTAVYTSAFTPPVGPLQAITNTQLLTCAYPTFRDGSTNNFTITVNGNTAVSTQNPFPLTTLPNPALGNQGNGVYSMSQYQSLLSQNLWPAVDPYWRYVTLMLHGNGTNGAQNNTFLDSSTNNFTITRNGNTTQGTFSPFGSNWSNYFDGTGDFLSGIGTTSSFNFMHNSSALFTAECWVYLSSTASEQYLFANNDGGSSQIGCALSIVAGGALSLFITRGVSGVGNVTAYVVSTGTVPTNQWVHIAVTYDQSQASSNAKFYINGASAGTGNKTGNTPSGSNATNTLTVGAATSGGLTPFNGYISNFRINNSIVYTAAFTPSTSPLTAITNTSLLTCQSNRFIDNSTNAFTITRNGDTSVQRFSPFNPTAPYAAGTDGGSGYFDGSGDYLRVASNTNAALSLGTSDFTYEAWVYPTAFVSGSSVIGVQTQTNGSATNGFALYLTNTGAPGVLAAASSGNYAVNFTGTAIPLNAWTHLAVTRSGNTFTLWRNGVSDGTATSSVTITQDSTSAYGGWNTGGSPQTGQGHNGYIVDRLTKSGALYSTTFTPPSAPFTTTVSAGTVSLLCSMTNAGIIDNAEMNNLETVGNAQISTAQSKFGGASMAFDGSGDSLIAPANAIYSFGTGNFTFECWLYINSLPGGVAGIFDTGTGVNASRFSVVLYSSGKIYVDNNTNLLISNTSLAAGQWYHIAVVREGTGTSQTKMFINGVLDVSGTVSTNFSSSNCRVGQTIDNFSLNGYIDDLRITKGFARYTSTFTPQRSQWQDQ